VGSAKIELVRRMFEAFGLGSFAAAAEFTHPDFEMSLPASHALGGAFRGPRDATKTMADFMDSFEGFRGEADEFIEAARDRVAVAFRERGRPRGGGVELEQRFGVLFTLRAGTIGRMEWFDSLEQALAAARVDASG
jgi:ketosteroid isomerase-like protein